MSAPELAQLEMLAQVDQLIGRLTHWVEPDFGWEPINHCQALVRRLLQRLEALRIRLEAPLVVATFGGTGTGKSALVNALVGREITECGRQRPTTTRPSLVAHSSTELEPLSLPLEKFDVVTCDSPVLRDIVIIDCPDPDTSEAATAGSNLEQLHQLLPHCDVLIYTSTQQKYRSARVVDELGQSATGCRLLFVQTCADVDEDIRDDWRARLEEHYAVPDLFLVDSLRALREQQAGRRPSGDFSKLQDLLTTQLAASQRTQIRRANLVDLVQAALDYCRDHLSTHWPALSKLESILEEQRQKLIGTMTQQLCGELLASRNLWERRLITSVTQNWGTSPFSSVLRFYNGMGNFIASFSLFRARTSAQMALIGAAQGVRWLTEKRTHRQSEDRLQQLGSFGLDDPSLREAQVVVSGYVQSAQLDPRLVESTNLDALRHEAVRVEGDFLGDASRRVDEIIDQLAASKSGFFTRLFYETLFLSFVGFVLFRVGKNFFYDSFIKSFLGQPTTDLLTVDFYISAGLFFVLWSGLLVMMFTRRLRHGLKKQVAALARNLAQRKLASGLFPQLEEACRGIRLHRERLEALSQTAAGLQHHIATAPGLGAQIVSGQFPVVAVRTPEKE